LGGPRFASSGINGILDIVEALRWVKANITAIGGDPSRVMVFGQSGGGGKTASLLSVPASYGLYHTAAILSCGTTDLQEPGRATEMAERLLSHLGIPDTDLDALLELPADRLLQASVAVGDTMSAFRPVLDGTIAVSHPTDAVATGPASRLPLLIGTTRDEMVTFTPEDSIPAGADDRWLEEQVTLSVEDPSGVVAAFRRSYPGASVWRIQSAIATWARMRAGSIRLAESRSDSGAAAPIWMYRFDWETPVPPLSGLAPHGVDVPFWFDNVEAAGISRRGQGRSRVTREVSKALVAMAARGIPEHTGLPSWPAYDTERRATMLFGVATGVAEDPEAELRHAWMSTNTRRNTL
jgi:para-nitrobenzyl esterase